MIWKNPFLIKSTEKIDSENDFLQLFSSNSLKFISEDRLNKVQFIRSSPGAGKTTVFKAFTSNILVQLNNMREMESLREFYQIASEYHLIEENNVKLMSCYISCAKNYDLIDQIFRNGRRQSVLFALLSVRITILLLRSIVTIKHLANTNMLAKITFKKYPDEFNEHENSINNGFDLLQWAYQEEKRVCEYIDSLSDEKPKFSFYYNTFFLLNFFEPNNILYDGEEFINYTLIMFDDVQKLTEHQRALLIQSFYTLRHNIGIWIGERFDALTSKEIVTSDAISGRDYEKIELEDYWRNNRNDLYKKTLLNIADRRVKLSQEDSIGSFLNCIENDFEYDKYAQELNLANMKIKSSIVSDHIIGGWFSDVIEYIESNDEGIKLNSMKWQLLDIIYRRESRGQIRLNFGDKFQIDSFELFCQKSNNRIAAEFYMCIKSKIPYYYGIDRLKEISSYNIGQFLSFCGVIFGKVNAKKIVSTGKKSNSSINAEDQEKYIKETSEKIWDDITQRYLYGEIIQRFIHNLCIIAQETRDSGTNPYTGGAITGVAIATDDIELLKTKDEYSLLLKVISACIASNYFEKSTAEHGGKTWLRLYFNRWICVRFQLPLKYGGWRKMNLDKMNTLTQKDLSLETQYENQISIFDVDSQEVVFDEL